MVEASSQLLMITGKLIRDTAKQQDTADELMNRLDRFEQKQSAHQIVH